ncbi:MAG TPA: TonB family protein [Caulobacteraceae bacterium]|jgi:TonB family protein
MKVVLFTIAALLVATAAAAEQPRHVQRWVDGAREQITQAAAAEATAPGTAVVRFSVSGDRRVNGVRIVDSSGLTAVDQAVLRAAKKVRADQLPSELLGRAVTLQIAVAPAGTVQAASTTTQAR